jgi:feruloyl esterase
MLNFQKSLVVASLGVSSCLGNSTNCSIDGINSLLSTQDCPLSANATVLSVVHVSSNGSFGVPESFGGLTPQFSTGLPDLCAVQVNGTSSDTSSYTFALFLPSEWNSKFLATGGGGAAGYINFLDMGAGSHYGFATMSTDNGHNSSAFDVTWAYQNPEGMTDWGWRAMHGAG